MAKNTVLTVTLLSLGSDLLVPTALVLAAGGYLAILVSVIAGRWMAGRTAWRAKQGQLDELQPRIDALGVRLKQFDDDEFAELKRLTEPYAMIRDAPTRPTVWRTA